MLPDGYIIETCPAAEDWWRKAAQVLGQGKLLAIDYGLTASELFSPARSHGTLRAYFRHHVGDDLLANVGQQDLTAHVNFSAIQIAGEACGLATEQFSTQSQFLTRIFQKTLREKPSGELVASKSDGGGSEGGWTSAHARQFQTLTYSGTSGQRLSRVGSVAVTADYLASFRSERHIQMKPRRTGSSVSQPD